MVSKLIAIVVIFHAVPSAIRFEVVRFGVRNWIGFLVVAEIRDHSPITARIDANHAIVRPREPVRASGARKDRVQLAMEKCNICDTTNQTTSTR